MEEQNGNLLIYQSDDGQTRLDLRIEGETIWLTQLEIAELFQTTKQNVSLHAKNIFEEAALRPEATVKESLTVRIEGKREVLLTKIGNATPSVVKAVDLSNFIEL
ncbi:MAG: virulence protein [Akkermansiaceae bacterium]